MKKLLTSQRGFTLIELMIAITISIILLNGVLQIFQSSKQSYRVADNLGRIQENARYALNVIAENTRQAGFLPCRIKVDAITGNNEVLNTVPPIVGLDTSSTDFFNSPIIGYEGNVSTFPSEFQGVGTAFGTRLAGSDAFRILRGSGIAYSVASKVDATAGEVAPGTDKCTATDCKFSATHSFDPGDVVIVCSTEGAAVSQLTASGQAAKTITFNAGIEFPPLQQNKNPPAQGSQVVKLSSAIFYIGASLATDGDVLATNSLYRRDLIYSENEPMEFGVAQELVQGIETMQVVYGVAATPGGAAIRYVSADNVAAAEWLNVVSVRVGLLFHTPEEIATVVDSTTYNVAGTAISSSGPVSYTADRRQRYIFSETIKLRNRGASVTAQTP